MIRTVCSVIIRTGAMLSISALLGVALPAKVSAQPSSCEPCLEVLPHVRFSSADGPIVPSLIQLVTRTGQGRFVVSHRLTLPQLVLYDSTGRFLKMAERSGEGPGEFQGWSVLPFPGMGDTTYVFDEYRLLRFDSDLRHIDTKPVDVGVTFKAAVLASGAMAVDQQISLHDSTFATVSLLSKEGSFQRAIESLVRPVVRTLIARSRDGGFWTMHPNGKLLRRYSPAATPVSAVCVAKDWFQPWNTRIPGEGLRERPRPRHEAIAELGNGLVLLLTSIADPQWRALVTDPGAPYQPAAIDGNTVYDTVVELLDPRNGRVLASARRGEWLQVVFGAESLLYSVHPGEMGHTTTQLWRVSVPAEIEARFRTGPGGPPAGGANTSGGSRIPSPEGGDSCRE